VLCGLGGGFAAGMDTGKDIAGVLLRARFGQLIHANREIDRVTRLGTPRTEVQHRETSLISIHASQHAGAIRTHLAHVIAKHQPDEVAVEGIIFVQSHRTAITMGAARAAALITAADHGLPVYEYAPRKIKMAVVGKGTADKAQVAFMVRALLGLAETPPADAADALAIGLAHLQASDPIRAKLLDRHLI
jgi:crossover junction endodeoxyribonuclease RuvC